MRPIIWWITFCEKQHSSVFLETLNWRTSRYILCSSSVLLDWYLSDWRECVNTPGMAPSRAVRLCANNCVQFLLTPAPRWKDDRHWSGTEWQAAAFTSFPVPGCRILYQYLWYVKVLCLVRGQVGRSEDAHPETWDSMSHFSAHVHNCSGSSSQFLWPGSLSSTADAMAQAPAAAGSALVSPVSIWPEPCAFRTELSCSWTIFVPDLEGTAPCQYSLDCREQSASLNHSSFEPAEQHLEKCCPSPAC